MGMINGRHGTRCGTSVAFCLKGGWLTPLLWLGIMLTGTAYATESIPQADSYERAIKARQTLTAFGPDLFGEQVNLQDGATTFQMTDVVVPTNSGLRMAVGRTLAIRTSDFDQYSDPVLRYEAFGNWALDVPYVIATMQEGPGWVSRMSDPGQRCSATADKLRPPGIISPTHPEIKWYYGDWGGLTINIPGAGREPLLKPVSPPPAMPQDGASYPWVTKGHWRVACTPTIRNGSGEGFVAVLPDGTKYTFDWMSSRRVNGVRDQVCYTYGGCIDDVMYYRREYRMYATRVEDRFGNWLAYTYDPANPRMLTRIESSDGARIDVVWINNKIDHVTTNGRTWRYVYSGDYLSSVLLPDGTSWTYYMDAQMSWVYPGQDARYAPGRQKWISCEPRLLAGDPGVVTIAAPSGAVGTFTFRPTTHGTTHTPGGCQTATDDGGGTSQISSYILPPAMAYRVLSLIQKTVTGPAMPTGMTWSYAYTPSWSWNDNMSTGQSEAPDCSVDDCSGHSVTTVTGPDGTVNEYTFGTEWWLNAGQLLQQRVLSNGVELQRTDTTYWASQPFPYSKPTPPGQPFAEQIGRDTLDAFTNNPLTVEQWHPATRTTLVRDGVTFTSTTDRFDAFARPLQTTRSSTLGKTRTDVTAYYDDLTRWVLGQVASRTNSNTGYVEERTDFDALARPWKQYSYGLLQRTLAYNTDGTLASVTDPLGRVTRFSDWMRGVPRRLQFPATAEAPSGAIMTAEVNGDGWPTAVTNEAGSKTCYAYDPMGRVSQVTWPSESQAGVCDSSAWNPSTVTYTPVSSAEYGVPAGHWRRTESTGDSRNVTYYDAFWRPLVVETYDATDPANTRSLKVTRYDASGRAAYASYPLRTLTSYTTPTTGQRTYYDGLDRVVRMEQDSELGVLATTTQYLSGLRTQVTNPRGAVTTTSFLAFDQPTTDWPVLIEGPEGVVTEIERNIFGRPRRLTQRNADGSQRVDRYQRYDVNQRVCKRVEPETGVTVLHYDLAGNVDWQADGATANTADCTDVEAVPESERVRTTRDGRNRPVAVSFPDGRGNQTLAYTADGLPAQATVYNATNNGQAVTSTFAYNQRRLLTSERLEQPAWYAWAVAYGYDRNASRSRVTYPNGMAVDYAPNALGQPTRAGTYATGITYFPNGGMAAFTYGNGVVHTLSQNLRQLPLQSRDALGGTPVLDDTYQYDATGNVLAIADGTSGHPNDRVMTYDARDRLRSVASAAFGQTAAAYTYDALDNLTSARVNDQTRNYWYDASNRLTNLIDAATGQTVAGLGYDAFGNLINHSGKQFDFDRGHRLRKVIYAGQTQEVYRYDAFGRRALAWSPTLGNVRSLYGQDGTLWYQVDDRRQVEVVQVMLNGSRVAEVRTPTGGGTASTRYAHTDALHSAVVETDAAGAVLSRTVYAPFGARLGSSGDDGPGYTGHVEDSTTGLVYMQQRYYDPTIGRFLSVDPVTANSNTGANFNRYWYANNNPYKFTDPDGRDCKSKDGQLSCIMAVTGSHVPIKFTVPAPNGFPSTSTSSLAGHHYDKPVSAGPGSGSKASSIRQSAINNPTPGQDKPATADGTANNASPQQGVLGQIGKIEPSPVMSYVRTDQNGNPMVVNVTLPGHPLFPGVVARPITVENGQTVIHNVGEGEAWKQSDFSPVAGWIQNAWIQQSQEVINGAE